MKFELLPDQIQLEAARALREVIIVRAITDRDQLDTVASSVSNAFCVLYQYGGSSPSKSIGGNAESSLK